MDTKPTTKRAEIEQFLLGKFNNVYTSFFFFAKKKLY